MLNQKMLSMKSWTVVHPYHSILLNNKKAQTSIDTANNSDKSQRNYIALKQDQKLKKKKETKANPKSYIVYDSSQ